MHVLRQLPFNVFIPGSKARQIICKDTEDAARFKYLSSAGVQKATSAQLEYIAHGKPGPDMVDHQLSCAQSALRAFPTLKSLAGDGREQIDRDLAKRINQEERLQHTGLDVCVLTQWPPVLFEKGPPRTTTCTRACARQKEGERLPRALRFNSNHVLSSEDFRDDFRLYRQRP